MRVLIRVLQLLLPVAVLGIAALLAITMVRNRPVVETQAPIIAPPGVRTHVVALETVQIGVASQGTVRPRTETQLVPEIAGRVTWVAPSFVTGGFFEAGDVLLRLDRFDYEQSVVSARSQLAQARLRLAQEEAEAEVAQREWETLGRGDPRELTLRKPQLEEARASVAAAEAGLERARRDLERAEVVAPYAGRVRTKSVDVGQFVTVGTPIATIYAVDVAVVGLPLPDEELAYLDLPLAYRGATNQPGPRVVLRATFAGATYEWGGRVVRTESEIDPVSRMVQVVAEVQDPYAQGSDPRRPPLAVGMYVEAEIEGRAFREIAVVPRSALRGGNQVLVIDDENRVRFRDVEILRATTESVYVDRGLSAGELVAVSSLDSPTDGMLVQVTGRDGGQLAEAAATEAEPVELSAPPEAAPEARSIEAPRPMMEPESDQPGWLRELLADAPAPASRRARREGLDPTAPTRGTRPVGRPAAETAPNPVVEAPRTAVPRVPAASALPPAAASEANAAPTEAVAILPFDDLNQGGTATQLGADLAASVATRLHDDQSIAVVPTASAASWIVGGGVQTLGEVVRVTARVVDQRDGDIVRAVKIDGTVTDLPRVHAEVAAAVRESIADVLNIAPMGAVAPASRRSIAVRPFSNVSQNPTDVVLSEAIARAVSERLADLESVTLVVAESEAAWVVTGGIQRIGDTVRITANLIDAREGAIVRAVKVDGPVDQLTRLQNDVAAELSSIVREVTS